MSSALPPTDCSSPSLTSPSINNLLVSIFLLFGILISYLPQHYRIIARGTSEGISPFFLLLGVTSGSCGLMNIWILGSGVVGCCRGLGPWKCFAGVLGILQVSMQWTCFMVILILFLVYFPTTRTLPTTEDADATPAPKHFFSTTHPTIGLARTITILCAVHFLALLLISIFLYLEASPHMPAWANSLGVQATILASIQYIPQIYTTFKLGHVGSLSIPMMCLQTPGSFVWALSLAAREGTAWSSWLVYVVTGCLQGILLVMCVGFEVKERRLRKRDETEVRRRMSEGLQNDATEESPLLQERQ